MGHPSAIGIERVAKNHAYEIFEKELHRRGWSKEHILGASLFQLEALREEINQAIQTIDQFETIRISWNGGHWNFEVPEKEEAEFVYSILPLLQERKSLALRHIRILEGELKIKNLQDLVDTVHNNDTRQRLEQELANFHLAQGKVTLLEQRLNDLSQDRLLLPIGLVVGLLGFFGILFIPRDRYPIK